MVLALRPNAHLGDITRHGRLRRDFCMSAKVKVTILLMTLCGVVPPARSIDRNIFPTIHTQQQIQDQTSQQQKTDAPPAKGMQVCDSDAPINCHEVKGVAAPKVLYAVDPKFPRSVRKKKLSGKSVVGLIVGNDGKPYHVHMVHSISEGLDPDLRPSALELDQRAMEAVQQYRFQPATYQGKPVPVEVNVEVNFRVY